MKTKIQMANSDNSKVVHSLIKSLGKYLKILGSNTLDGLVPLWSWNSNKRSYTLFSNYVFYAPLC